MMPYCGYERHIITIFGRDFTYYCRQVARHIKVINFNQIAACDKHLDWYYENVVRMETK